MRGIVAAATGDAAAAKDDFSRLLAINPDAKLPAGTSPKITKPFAAAAAELAGKPAVAAKVERSPGEPSQIMLDVTSDPLAMIAGARALITVDDHALPPQLIKGTGRIAIALPHGHRITVHVVGVDAYGNRVVEPSDAEAVVEATDGNANAPPVGSSPTRSLGADDTTAPAHVALYREWWLYGGATVIALGVGGAFAIAGHSATNEANGILGDSAQHTYAQSTTVEARARRDFDVANVGFVVGGAFAIAAGIVYATRPHARDRQEHARLAPTPMPGGGGLALEGRF